MDCLESCETVAFFNNRVAKTVSALHGMHCVAVGFTNEILYGLTLQNGNEGFCYFAVFVAFFHYQNVGVLRRYLLRFSNESGRKFSCQGVVARNDGNVNVGQRGRQQFGVDFSVLVLPPVEVVNSYNFLVVGSLCRDDSLRFQQSQRTRLICYVVCDGNYQRLSEVHFRFR